MATERLDVKLIKEREPEPTEWWTLYEEVGTGYLGGPVLGTLSIQKWAVHSLGNPERIKVAIEPVIEPVIEGVKG